jgi:hypothetical protein
MRSGSSGRPEGDLPWPRRMACSMEDLESWPFFAAAMAAERRELKVGLGPWTIGLSHHPRMLAFFLLLLWRLDG